MPHCFRLNEWLSRTCAADERPILAFTDINLSEGEYVEAFNACHVNAGGLSFATHEVVRVDPADSAEKVLGFLGVPLVLGYQFLALNDLKGLSWRSAHDCALARAKGTVAPEVRT